MAETVPNGDYPPASFGKKHVRALWNNKRGKREGKSILTWRGGETKEGAALPTGVFLTRDELQCLKGVKRTFGEKHRTVREVRGPNLRIWGKKGEERSSKKEEPRLGLNRKAKKKESEG